jgi:hypothetical protein
MVSRRSSSGQSRTDAHAKDRWLLVDAHATKRLHMLNISALRSAAVVCSLLESNGVASTFHPSL